VEGQWAILSGTAALICSIWWSLSFKSFKFIWGFRASLAGFKYLRSVLKFLLYCSLDRFSLVEIRDKGRLTVVLTLDEFVVAFGIVPSDHQFLFQVLDVRLKDYKTNLTIEAINY
jgi:hypothetical protein